jgi:ribosome-associated protein
MQTRFSPLPVEDKIKRLADWLREKQGLDVLGLDVRGLTSAMDAMVLATARNSRQAQAMADHVLVESKAERFEVLGIEGYQAGTWILMDLNDVVLHIFRAETREYFNLEGLWSRGKVVFRQEDSGQGDAGFFKGEEA